MSGSIADPNDGDVYSIDLLAGDTLSLGLDLDPTRDGTTFNGRLGIGEFNGQFLAVDDDGATGGVGGDPIPSEAFNLTVRDAGTYYVYVDARPGGGVGDYRLSVTVHAAAMQNCTTYASTDVPQVVADGGMASSVISVPGNPLIGDMYVDVELDHEQMEDLDVNLRSPMGNDNGLFGDIGCGPDIGRACDPAVGTDTLRARFGDETPFPVLLLAGAQRHGRPAGRPALCPHLPADGGGRRLPTRLVRG